MPVRRATGSSSLPLPWNFAAAAQSLKFSEAIRLAEEAWAAGTAFLGLLGHPHSNLYQLHLRISIEEGGKIDFGSWQQCGTITVGLW